MRYCKGGNKPLYSLKYVEFFIMATIRFWRIILPLWISQVYIIYVFFTLDSMSTLEGEL